MMQQVKYSQLALFGYPLTYSLSPQIHHLFAKNCAIDLTYALYSVAEAFLDAKIEQFVRLGGKGFNVTTPYKQKICNKLQSMTQAAQIAGAVNTVKILADGSLHGENTDGAGFLFDLQMQQIAVKNKTVLLLGAGGAANGIFDVICQQEPKHIIAVNRDIDKALFLQAKFNKSTTIDVITYTQLIDIRPDLIINTLIPAAIPKLSPYLNKLNFIGTTCYDLNYNFAMTDFMQLALMHGAIRVSNGLGMLIAQAARSFYFWHGIYPDIKGILPHLKQYLQQK